jgi:hypothetical protein
MIKGKIALTLFALADVIVKLPTYSTSCMGFLKNLFLQKIIVNLFKLIQDVKK